MEEYVRYLFLFVFTFCLTSWNCSPHARDAQYGEL